MADTTEIAWCDSTFNPWIGCTKVGPGCDNCYAEREFDHRHHRAKWGPGQERVRTSAHNWNQPMRWNKNACWFVECNECGWRGESKGTVCGHCHGTDLTPARRRVFCASLADVFDNEVPAQWRADLFALIFDTPNIDWMLLTKRIGNVRPMASAAMIGALKACAGDPLRLPGNLWLGATIVNQAEAYRDIPKLLSVPAAVRFVSMEPLLGPVRLNLATTCDRQCSEFQNAECPGSRGLCAMQNALDWVIVGGESGPKARPMHPDWVRSLRYQCAASGVPFLFKQWGEWAEDKQHGFATGMDGGIRARRFDDGTLVERIGKRYAGRFLDGKLHNEFPEVAP